MLQFGLAGGRRRSDLVGIDVGRDQAEDGRGWIEVFSTDIPVTLRGTNAWRVIEIA